MPFLKIQQLPYTFDNVFIIFQCPDSHVLESQVVVKKETDLVSVKEETPADKACPNNNLTSESTCKTANNEEGKKN